MCRKKWIIGHCKSEVTRGRGRFFWISGGCSLCFLYHTDHYFFFTISDDQLCFVSPNKLTHTQPTTTQWWPCCQKKLILPDGSPPPAYNQPFDGLFVRFVRLSPKYMAIYVDFTPKKMPICHVKGRSTSIISIFGHGRDDFARFCWIFCSTSAKPETISC